MTSAQLELRKYLLPDFVDHLNPLISPSHLYICGVAYRDRAPMAWACSRRFEYARLVLEPDAVYVSHGSPAGSSRRSYGFAYEDPQLFDKLRDNLVRLADTVVTPGWSRREIRTWRRQQLELLAEFSPRAAQLLGRLPE